MTVAARGFYAIALTAAAALALSFGTRQSMSLFIGPINSETAMGYATISLALAVGQLMWGVAQPIAGALADKHGTRPVMITGALMLATATAATPFAKDAWVLTALVGVLAAAGAGAIAPAMLVSASMRWIPLAKQSVVTGIVNAGGSFGQFTILPLAQLLIAVSGWQPALMMLGALTLLTIPIVVYLTNGAPAAAAHPAGGPTNLKDAVAGAARDPSYLLLTAGFFTCGFHVAFIATHLPGVVASCELPPTVAAWSLAVIGLFNMIGSLWIGKFVQTRRMKLSLAGLYLARAVLIIVFYLSPKTPEVFLLFSAGIGFTYLSTVPPTVGLVIKLYGVRYVATLFGLVMLSHQVGAFLGAWLGGKAFEASGNYDWMWFADIALCLFAAVVHLPIREAKPQLAATPA
jgi:predicted MFS family arabinose efflux permease